jgi:hypothetical protein
MQRKTLSAGIVEDSEGPDAGFWGVIFGRNGQVRWHTPEVYPDMENAFAAARAKKLSFAPTVVDTEKPDRGKK